MEYAVRGPLVIRAAAIEKELEQVNAQLWIASCEHNKFTRTKITPEIFFTVESENVFFTTKEIANNLN